MISNSLAISPSHGTTFSLTNSLYQNKKGQATPFCQVSRIYFLSSITLRSMLSGFAPQLVHPV